jgi:CheY-like chemotaxis protein
MSTPKFSIFIVEDSEIERSMLSDHLSKYNNVEVTTFSSGDFCLKELIFGNVEEPDLILMDYFLDSTVNTAKDGLETLTKLKEIAPFSKVIMLTSVENKRIMDLAKQKGAHEYLIKGTGSYQKLDEILTTQFSLTSGKAAAKKK